MNFFEHQEAARRHTALLVFYFVLAVTLIIGVIYAAAAILMFVVDGELQGGGQPRVFEPSVLWQPDVLLAVVGGTLLLVAGGTTVKLVALRGGGKKVAESLGGRQVSHDTRDANERRLVNIVEEMAIASGINVPAIYVMDGESSINAFAAGLAPNQAAIAVTRGTLERLDRDELQGVIAHEFSHIFNSDMRLNLRLIGVLNGILWIGIAGRVMLEGFLRGGSSSRRRSSSDSKGGGGAVILAIIAFAVVLLVVGYIGLFFGKLIKSAVSRQREFLADASAVQFTRNPAGIAGALKKIGGLSTGSRIRSGRAEEASHMFFGDALGRQMLASMATHPPISERVRRIEPTWDGSYPSAVAEPSTPVAAAAPPGMAASAAAAVQIAHAHEAGQAAGFAGSAGGGGGGGEPVARPPAPAAPRSVHVDPARVVATVGTVSPDQVRYGEQLLASLPEALKRAAHDPVSAPSVVMALLLDRADASAREAQLAALEGTADAATLAETQRLGEVAREIDVHARLPLVQIAGPALARLSPEQAGELRERVRVLIDADQHVDLFEYAMLKMLSPTLADRARKGPHSFYSMKPLVEDIEVLLSALARHGHADDATALGAFQAGAARIRGHSLALRVAEACDLDALDAALERLAGAVPAIRARAMEACAYTVAADGEVALEEAELLRAVGAALSCPLPPFL